MWYTKTENTRKKRVFFHRPSNQKYLWVNNMNNDKKVKYVKVGEESEAVAKKKKKKRHWGILPETEKITPLRVIGKSFGISEQPSPPCCW